jgi:hypothetical protein
MPKTRRQKAVEEGSKVEEKSVSIDAVPVEIPAAESLRADPVVPESVPVPSLSVSQLRPVEEDDEEEIIIEQPREDDPAVVKVHDINERAQVRSKEASRSHTPERKDTGKGKSKVRVREASERVIQLEQKKQENERLKIRADEQKRVNEFAKNISKALKQKSALKQQLPVGEDEDDKKRRLNLWRQYTEYLKLGFPGTGANVTVRSPLDQIQREVDAQEEQCNEKRCEGHILSLIDMAVVGVSIGGGYVGIPLSAPVSLVDVWKRARSPEVDTDGHLNLLLSQINIKYGSMFAIGPEMALAGCIFKMAAEVAEVNRQTMAHGAPPAEPENEEDLEDYIKKYDDL